MHPTAAAAVAFVVEDEAGDPYYCRDTAQRAYRSAVVTLSLSVLGSSVLPLPYSISKTGVLAGLLTMLVVAWCNAATSDMLIRAAARTGHTTYEGLAEWAGGASWRAVTQASLLALLWGTLTGGLALISDVAAVMAANAFPGGQAPEFLDSRVLMSAAAIFVVFPLCMQRHMRQLETAATAGVGLVLGLVALLAVRAAWAGLPGITSGDVPLWYSARADRHLPEAAAVIGYAFYLQPMMVALLPEMPAGAVGVAALRKAVRAVLYGVSFAIYAAMGVSGAALFGKDTEGNIMVNKLVDGRAATLALYGGMLVYLALGMTTTQFALRQSLDVLLVGEGAPFSRRRQAVLTTACLGTALCVALVDPSGAERIIALVGATGVAMVAYVVPVAVALMGHARGWRPREGTEGGAAAGYMAWHASSSSSSAAAVAAAAASLAAPLLVSPPGGDPNYVRTGGECGSGRDGYVCTHEGDKTLGARWRAARRRAFHLWEGAVEPVLVGVIGVGFSVSALYVAISAL
jgi:amino acid permease